FEDERNPARDAGQARARGGEERRRGGDDDVRADEAEGRQQGARHEAGLVERASDPAAVGMHERLDAYDVDVVAHFLLAPAIAVVRVNPAFGEVRDGGDDGDVVTLAGPEAGPLEHPRRGGVRFRREVFGEEEDAKAVGTLGRGGRCTHPWCPLPCRPWDLKNVSRRDQSRIRAAARRTKQELRHEAGLPWTIRE